MLVVISNEVHERGPVKPDERTFSDTGVADAGEKGLS